MATINTNEKESIAFEIKLKDKYLEINGKKDVERSRLQTSISIIDN